MNARSASMDIGKGVLVLVMLLHHAWSPLRLSGNDSILGIVGFVSSAFILFSGFLFGGHLLDSYLKSPVNRWRRDVGRGARLLSIFLAVNILLYFIDYRDTRHMGFGEWLLICLQPNPHEIVAFSLLNAFGYFFIAIATLYIFTIYLAKLSKMNIRIALFLSVGVTFIVFVQYSGTSSDFDAFLPATVMYGFLGTLLAMVVGRIPPDRSSQLVMAGSVGFIAYLLIALLTLAGALDPYTFYMPFVLLASLAVWRLAVWFEGREHNFAFILFKFLGKYTLLAYMLQVIIHQLISLRLININAFTDVVWQAFLLSIIIMASVMLCLMLLVDYLRKLSKNFDVLYRVVMG